MAVTILFQKTAAKIGSLTIDASVTETHAADVDVTEHPVERGANITDHARPKLETLQLEGLISNHVLAGRDSAFDATRAGSAYQALLDLKNGGAVLTVVTGIRTYENMLIQGLSVPRTKDDTQRLRFTCNLKEVRTVSSGTATVTDDKAAAPKNLGKKNPTKTPAQLQKESLLSKGRDFVQTGGGLEGLIGSLKGAF